MTTNDPLHLIFAAAAFDHAAAASEAWATAGDQSTAAAMFSELLELMRTRRTGPESPPELAVQAVVRVCRAYEAAARTVRSTGLSLELGHGEVQQRGCAFAADWLQSHADAFRTVAAQLGAPLPPEHQDRVVLKTTIGSPSAIAEFATLAVVLPRLPGQQDNSPTVYVHASETAASTFFHEHFPGADLLHRVDTHSLAVRIGDQPEKELRRDLPVEFRTLGVVHDGQINVTAHLSTDEAYEHLRKHFRQVVEQVRRDWRIAGHRAAVTQHEKNDHARH